MAEAKARSWDVVENALENLAHKTAAVAKIESGYEVMINDMKSRSDAETKKLKDEIARIEKDIEKYCAARKSEFDDVRILELEFGSVGYRKSPPSVACLPKFTWEKAMNKALELQGKFRKALRVKTEFDKNALKTLGDADLKKIGLTIVEKEEFQLNVKKVLTD